MRAGDINGWEELGTTYFSLSTSNWALVPLEAWRRGLRVTLRPNARYTISDEYATYSFWQTRLTGVTGDRIAKLCDDKQATREVLHTAGVPVPEGQLFSVELDKEEIRKYADKLGYPVCLKPNDWAKGRGVFPKVENSGEFATALDVLVDDLGCRNVVVEQHIPGVALRIFVAGGKTVSATLAEAANVVGDGRSTIAELVDEKVRARASNPHLRHSTLALDEAAIAFLAEHNLTAQDVPVDGQTVQLRAAANLALGGDSWDITDSVSDAVADVAVAAVDAIPELRHAAIDLLVDDPYAVDASAFVNEINPSAGLGGHLYPAKGERHDVVAAIVDQYFPNTARAEGSENWYFSLNQANRLFTARVSDEVSLAPMPSLRTPRWATLRLLSDEKSLSALRSALVAEFSKGKVHGRVAPVRDGQFDAFLVGEKSIVDASERTLRNIAAKRGATVKPVSKMAFRAATGFLA